MIEAAVIALRFVQYATGSIMLGSALFLVCVLPRESRAQAWAKPLLASATIALALSSLLGLVAQTIMLAGSVELGLTTDSLQAMVESTSLAKAALVRTATAGAAAAMLLLFPAGRFLWTLTGLLGVIAVGSFAWMGHGAATEGPGAQIHLLAEIAHAQVAGIWVGALAGFVMLVRYRCEPLTLQKTLRRFSAFGVPLVALLVLSGLVNSWYLIGLQNLGSVPTTTYSRLLSAKLGLFVLMLILASANRWRHTPAITMEGASLAGLRLSLMAEAALGALVLLLVAWFGMLEPPTS